MDKKIAANYTNYAKIIIRVIRGKKICGIYSNF